MKNLGQQTNYLAKFNSLRPLQLVTLTHNKLCQTDYIKMCFMAKNTIINIPVYSLLELNEVLAANTCLFGRLALFALHGDRDNVRFNGTYPQSPPLWVFFIGRNSKETQPRLVSSSITASDRTTTIQHFGNTKATDSKKMYDFIMGGGQQKVFFAFQGGVPVGT